VCPDAKRHCEVLYIYDESDTVVIRKHFEERVLLKSAARIPRATCRLFGTIKALGNIKDSVILVHGPKGCVYHINYILGMRATKHPTSIRPAWMKKTSFLAPQRN